MENNEIKAFIDIGYLKEFWVRIKNIPKDNGTEYDVTLINDSDDEDAEETTFTDTIVGHLRNIYQNITNIIGNFIGGSSSIKGKDDKDLLKVDVQGGTGVPSVTMALTTKDSKNRAITNTQIASKEYVDKMQDTYDGRYIAKSATTSNTINVDKNGSMANFSTNGQAYLAVRPKEGAEFLPQIPQPYAGAAFGVKLDGTTAFSHKTYTSYNTGNGTYSGARNTAVLQFAGPIGLRYAKNTSSGNDVSEDMYKYVGVIDSEDEFQRVYSAKQVDDIIAPLVARIEALERELNINNSTT